MTTAVATRRELLLGCGARRDKFLSANGRTEWEGLVTLDVNHDHRPDVIHDLDVLPYPFYPDSFDEVHAYDVLEHLGAQGDWQAFFSQFAELWRILKPGGLLMAIVPAHDHQWAWGDPGHRRVITEGTLSFLSQAAYERAVGKSPMSDFRFFYKADFEPVFVEKTPETLRFALKAIKRGDPQGDNGHGRRTGS